MILKLKRSGTIEDIIEFLAEMQEDGLQSDFLVSKTELSKERQNVEDLYDFTL